MPLPHLFPLGMGLCGHADRASRLPGKFAVFCRSELGARAKEMDEAVVALSVLHNIMR